MWCLSALLTGFVGLAALAHVVKRGTSIDHSVLGWMLDHQRGFLTKVAAAFTTAASPESTGMLALIAAVVCWRRYRAPLSALVIVGVVLVASGVATLAKIVVAEQRPPGSRQFLLDINRSFPSGHVTGTLALLGILAVVIGRGRAAPIRWGLGLVVTAVTMAVALSRLYLGVHWVTDIGGGLLLGGAGVLVGSLALRTAAPVQLGT